MYQVSKQCKNRLAEFAYTSLYHHNFKGGYLMVMNTESNISIEQQLQMVADATKAVTDSGKDPPKYQLAVQMLRLMNGETQVLKELPTLNKPVQLLQVNSQIDGNTLMAATSETSIENSKGLLGLTKQNIKDIKNYVKKALALPTTPEQATTQLGYTDYSPFSADHPEFSPSRFAQFYQPFHDHAEQWDSLERNIIEQGQNVGDYGNDIVRNANFVLEQIKKMDILATVEDVIITDPRDRKMQQALVTILERWQQETQQYYNSTNSVLASLVAYRACLVNNLHPSATSMLDLLNKLDIAQEAANLKQEMETLQKDINTKQKEYERACGLAFTGAAGLPLGAVGIITWAVTGGIFGAMAERIRKERNKLQEQLNVKKALYNNLNQVAGHVHQATDGIEDLSLAMTNAEIGLRTLSTVWESMVEYIKKAKGELESINKKDELLIFMFELESARDHWEKVPSITEGLLRLFNEADKSL